ncbi:hypothetical protein HZS_6820 [Henneguya salminicola]|nr:hypothetical protein HZS_6820 [Henneguya salminicola]
MLLIRKRKILKRPTSTAISQQDYAAFRFKKDPLSVLAISLVWLAINIGLIIFLSINNLNLFDKKIDYTHCQSVNTPPQNCYNINGYPRVKCQCLIKFNIEKDIPLPIYISFGIRGIYQNNRGFFNSFDPLQLNGHLPDEPRKQCGEFRFLNDTAILPCGMMAYSLFNGLSLLYYFISDTMILEQTQQPNNKKVKLNYIPLLSSDLRKFKNPPIPEGETLASIFGRFIKPTSWAKDLATLDANNPQYNGVCNPDFVNWMLTAPFKKFIKPFREISITSQSSTLKMGEYIIKIDYNYPLKDINGTKWISLSQISKFGAKNQFLFFSSIVSSIFTTLIAGLGLLQLAFGIVLEI